MKSLNICVIGVGGRGMAHVRTIPLLSDKYRLVAVCDVDARKVEQTSTALNVPGYTDIVEMVEKETIDVGIIAVQAEGHHPIAKFLAERKINIITETPMAITASCADIMIEAAEAHGVLLEVSENVIRWPNERVKQLIVSSGMLGQVRQFYLSYTSGSYHGMAGVRAILGKEARSVTGEFPDEEKIAERAEITFEDEIVGIYENNAERRNYWEIIGEKGAIKGNELELFASGQKFPIATEHTSEGGFKTIKRTVAPTDPEISYENPYQQYALAEKDDVARADVLMSMYNAVADGKPLNYGPENGKKDVELVVAVRESAWSNNRVLLPLKGLTTHEKLIDEEFRQFYEVGLHELALEHLKKPYSLPDRLHSLLYKGRL